MSKAARIGWHKGPLLPRAWLVPLGLSGLLLLGACSRLDPCSQAATAEARSECRAEQQKINRQDRFFQQPLRTL